MLAVVFGLLSAALYGGADFIGGFAAKRASVLAVTVISQAAGLVVLLALAPLAGGHPQAGDIGWGLFAGLFGGAGIAMLYHALSIGKMGVVSPITAVLAAIVPVTVGIVRGHPLLWFQYAGIAAALISVGLISYSREESGEREISTEGVKEALAAGALIGVFFVILLLSRPSAGVGTLLAARIASVCFLLLLAFISRAPLHPRGTLPYLLAAGAFDMLANFLFVLAAQTGALAIAAVLCSLYPASTVFLARIVLNERLGAVQKFGVALALLGVGLIAA